MNRTSVRRRVGRFFMAAGVLALSIWAYLLWTPEPEEWLPTELVGPRDDLLTTLAVHLGAPVLEGNSIEHLRNGDEIFPAMLGAIGSASRTVDLLTYVYWAGDIADQFGDALIAAAARGVEVRVLLDAVGAAKMDDDLVEELRAGGCMVEWFHPLDWYSLRRFNRRTHRKVLVVDGEIGFTGGVGIADEWSGDARNESEWRDDHFRTAGPVTRWLAGSFADNWRSATGEVLTRVERPPVREAPGGARLVPLLSSPPDDLSPVGFSYWLTAKFARERFDIVTPYFLPDPNFVQVLVETARRGVEVRLLLPGEHNDSRMIRWASQTRYPELLEAGVQIHEYEPTMLHSKLVLVDDRIAILGSANFDNRSFELNDEIQLVIEDAALHARLAESLSRDLERARRVTKDAFEGVRWWQRLAGSALLLFREQL